MAVTPEFDRRASACNGSAEHRLLLACACTRLDVTAQAQLEALLKQGVNWNYLLSLAQRHRLVPLLYNSLDAVGFRGVPAATRQLLQARALTIVRNNLVLTRELATLLDAFAASGINAVPCKGPELALKYYGELGLRQFGDIDIIIRRERFFQAKRLLQDRGYQPCLEHGPASEAAHLRTRHDYMFVRDDGVVVDLQWGMMQRPFVFAVDPRRAIETVELAGRPFPALAAEELLIVLCVHGSKHLWERLGWVCDLAEMLRARPNLSWATMLERARSLRVERMVRIGLLLAAKLHVATLPPEIVRWMSADRVASLLAAQAFHSFWHQPDAPSLVEVEAPLFYLRMHEHLQDRLRLYVYFLPSLLHPRQLWSKYGFDLLRPFLDC